jgi:hypothetical protein
MNNLLRVLPLEHRIIKAIKERDRQSTLTGLSSGNKEDIKKDFIKLMQKTPDFRELSPMAITQIFN